MGEERAEALLALGHPAQALAEMEQASDDLERWRQTLTDRELRVLAFQAGDQFGGPSPALAGVVAAAVRNGWQDRAFALAEKRRARDLVDQRYRAEVLASASHQSGLPPEAAVVSLSGLSRAVPDDSTAVLEFVTGPAGALTTVFVVTRSVAQARTLAPADSLGQDIELFDDLIDQRRTVDTMALKLGTRILAPALAVVPPRIVRLVVVADGPLHRIPFAALRLPGGVVVVDRYAVSLAPSGTVAADLWAHPTQPTNRVVRVLAFGDPIPEATDASTTLAVRRDATPATHTADVERLATTPVEADETSPLDAVLVDPAAPRDLPRLPWSADEARMVAAFGRESEVRIGPDATPAALAAAPLDSFAIVHFATHAIVDEQVPARSALILSRSNGQSGLVNAGSLELLPLASRLIVLSACRTARGALVEGEGVRGLANPLLGAGAHAVLATQWAVGDRATVPLVYVIYTGLAAGLPVSEALRRAEAAARHRGAPVREWAAFTLTGDPLVRIPLQTPDKDAVPAWVRAASAATAMIPAGR